MRRWRASRASAPPRSRPSEAKATTASRSRSSKREPRARRAARSRALEARRLADDRVDAIERVDRGDLEDQRSERRLVVVALRLVPDLVRHRIAAVAQTGRGLGQP